MQSPPDPAVTAPAAPRAQAIANGWHRIECWIAVVAFAFIALILLADVMGREVLGPLLRLLGFPATATGIFASQKLSLFALVIGAFAGIGIATATASHLVPRVGFAWIPASWEPWFNRLADVVTGVFLAGAAYYGWVYVQSSIATDLRAPVLDWSVWPVQLAIPIGFMSAAARYFMFAAWPAIRPRPPEFQE